MSILKKCFRTRAFAIVGSMTLFGPVLVQGQPAGVLPVEPPVPPLETVVEVHPEPLPIAVPHILSEKDALLYIDIFRLQKEGNWRQADKLRKKIDNKILIGHILFQRYMHPTKYRSRFSELRDWMAKYADQPGAWRVYRLAMRRKPAKARNPKVPTPLHYKSRQRPVQTGVAPKRLTREDRAKRKKEYSIRSKISYNLKRDRIEHAEKRLWAAENAGLFGELAFDTQLSRIAARYYYSGDNEKRAP